MRASAVATRKFYGTKCGRPCRASSRRARSRRSNGRSPRSKARSKPSDRMRKDVDDAKMSVGVDDNDMQAGESCAPSTRTCSSGSTSWASKCGRAWAAPARQGRADRVDPRPRARRGDTRSASTTGASTRCSSSRLKDLMTEVSDEKLQDRRLPRQQLGGYTDRVGRRGRRHHGRAIQGGHQALLQHRRARRRRHHRRGLGAQGSLDAQHHRLVAERKRELKLLDDEFKDVHKTARRATAVSGSPSGIVSCRGCRTGAA